MYTTRIPGNADTEQTFAIPAKPAPAIQHYHTPEEKAEISTLRAEGYDLLKIEGRVELSTDQKLRLCEISDRLWELGGRLPDCVGRITLEIKIDMDSPEIQVMLRKNADHVACAVDSVDHGSKVIQYLEQSRAECVGPTNALDHMIAAVERRIGRLEHAVKVEAEALHSWRNNWAVAQEQSRATSARKVGCADLVRWAIGEARKIRFSRF